MQASSIELDRIATAELLKWGYPKLIKPQLYFVPLRFSRKQRQHLEASIAAIPIEQAVNLLPVVDKISVQMGSVGLLKTCQILPLGVPADEADREHVLEDVSNFFTVNCPMASHSAVF